MCNLTIPVDILIALDGDSINRRILEYNSHGAKEKERTAAAAAPGTDGCPLQPEPRPLQETASASTPRPFHPVGMMAYSYVRMGMGEMKGGILLLDMRLASYT